MQALYDACRRETRRDKPLMVSTQDLKVSERDTTLTPRQLRAAGFIPATIYGKGTNAREVQVRTHEFQQFYTHGIREFAMSGFVQGHAQAKQVQVDAVSRKPLAIEFCLAD